MDPTEIPLSKSTDKKFNICQYNSLKVIKMRLQDTKGRRWKHWKPHPLDISFEAND
jgi:hypothetical protein